MPDQLIAVMTVKKETPGKVVFEETDASPHYDSTGVRMNIYVPKPAAKLLLAKADTITMVIEAGDATQAEQGEAKAA